MPFYIALSSIRLCHEVSEFEMHWILPHLVDDLSSLGSLLLKKRAKCRGRLLFQPSDGHCSWEGIDESLRIKKNP